MIYVLYHHPCQDGFGAAYSAWKKFGSNAKYVGVNYGKPFPEIPNASEVFIVDFSYPKDVLVELSKKVKLTVLDHHVTAEKDLAGLSFAQFDMKRSGAGMSWDYFHPDKPRPWIINYIEDRDLWKHSLENCHEIIAALFSFPEDFSIWDKFEKAELLNQGKAILRYKGIVIDEMCANAKTVKMFGFENVVIVNASSSLVSDIGNRLLEKNPQAPFVAVYYDTKGGQRKWSLRSNDQKENVELLAAKMGGGGHRNAAGFLEKEIGDVFKLNL